MAFCTSERRCVASILYLGGRGSSSWQFSRFSAPGVCVKHLVVLEGELVQWLCLLASQRVSLWSLKLIGYCVTAWWHTAICVWAGGLCFSTFFLIVLKWSSLVSSCEFHLPGIACYQALLWDANNCIFATEPYSTMVPWRRVYLGSIWQTWLILPVVICLSQRLSHACLSISFYTAKLRMAH